MINVLIDLVHNSSRICIRNKDMIRYIGKYVYFVSMLKRSILYYRKYEISSTFLFEIQNILYMYIYIYEMSYFNLHSNLEKYGRV